MKEGIDYVKQISKNTNEIKVIINATKAQLETLINIFDKFDGQQDKLNLNQIKLILKKTSKILGNSNKKINEIEEYNNKSLSVLESFYHKTNVDQLTGLYNYVFADNLMNILLEEKQDFNLVYIDLNKFKVVNDTYGHLAGDEMLVEFAKKLKMAFGNNNETFLIRRHGDEFNIISFLSKDEIRKKIDKIKMWCETQSLEFVNKNTEKKEKTYIEFSFGISNSKENNYNLADILHSADKEMYKNKHKDR